MKKIIRTLMMVCVCALALLTGCGKDAGKQDLQLKDGNLVWASVSDAVKYEVTIGSNTEVVEDTSYNLADALTYAGEFTIKVNAVDAQGQVTEVGTKEVRAEQTIAKPVVSIMQKEEKAYFTWEANDDAKSYSYDAHDGKGILTAAPDKDGKCVVEITEEKKQMIDVTAHGTSTDSVVKLSQKVTYTYHSSRIFDMALLAKYPALYTSSGRGEEKFSVGTTLEKGVYELEVSVYVMDAKGYKLSGNGRWGRRIQDTEGKFAWFCDTGVTDFPESKNTLCNPDEVTTHKLKLAVDRGSNAVMTIGDFSLGEKLVVADVRYNGKSVLNAKGGKPNKVPEIKKMDVKNLDKYVAVYRSTGVFYADSPDACEITLPVKLADGKHTISVDYYICSGKGDVVEGNGLWGRRIAGADVETGTLTWYNEYDLPGHEGVDIPLPTVKQTSKFAVEVKDGKCKIVALDFGMGEMILIEKVNTAKIPSGNGIFVSKGDAQEVFEVETTLKGKPRHSDVTLEITYTVSDIFGNSLTGNGAWGRRMEAGDKLYWMCEKAVENFPQSQGTLPKAGKTYKDEFFFYEINKFGIMTIQMYDFESGDMVQIKSIKYNGKEVLVK